MSWSTKKRVKEQHKTPHTHKYTRNSNCFIRFEFHWSKKKSKRDFWCVYAECVCASVCARVCVSKRLSLIRVYVILRMYVWRCNGCQKAVSCCCRHRCIDQISHSTKFSVSSLWHSIFLFHSTLSCAFTLLPLLLHIYLIIAQIQARNRQMKLWGTHLIGLNERRTSSFHGENRWAKRWKEATEKVKNNITHRFSFCLRKF